MELAISDIPRALLTKSSASGTDAGQGRYRQLHQFGMELIGSESPQADAEIVPSPTNSITAAGLMSSRVSINSIGRPADRAAYGEAILEHLSAWLKDQETEEQEKARKNPLA
ncbi:MAG: ATP phosphoribosyltransferase regulatory subunit [Fimbriimonadaceae bacterium]